MSPYTIAVPMIILMGIFMFLYKKKTILNFRTALPTDLPQLQLLAISSYSVFKNSLGTNEFELLKMRLSSTELWDKLMQKSICFICEDYNRIVGMVFFFPSNNPDEHFEKNWSYIRLLGVHPEYNGKGIAKKLMQMSIEEAAASGEKIIALHTSEYMKVARHIYEKLEFKIIRELPLRFGKRYWLYVKELSKNNL
jgi:ribosomal protein S18 acetylase RimI-like enzyme